MIKYQLFPYRYRVLILLFFFTLITYLDRTSISLVGIRIKNEFRLNNEEFGWVLGAFALAYALFEIPSGILGDRIGQRSLFIRIVLWWSLFTALTGLATGLTSLICIRFLFGMGESGAYPTCSSVIARWFPIKEIARGTSVLTMGSTTGAALAPLLVIPIAAAWGWRFTFFVNGVLGIIWVLVCLLWFRNFPSEMHNISKAEQSLIEKDRRFKNKHRHIEWNQVIKNPTIWALSGMFFCSQCINYFFIAWMPIYLQEGRQFSEGQMKMTTSAVFIGGFLGAIAAGFTSDWLVAKKGLIYARRLVGSGSFALMGILIFITAITVHNNIAVTCLIIAYFFYLPSVISSFSTCVDIGGENTGTITGVMNFFGQLGSFCLAIFFGRMAHISHGFKTPLFALSGVLLIGGLLWLIINPTTSVSTETSC
jgi:ACS family glucarate transporter-like MFS transporter